ncbi:MAG: tetratricopeptide repeat protein [Rhizomicrobium sp.]
MKATGARLIHWVLLAGLLIAATLAVLMWSTHSVSYPNPADQRRPVDRLSQNSAQDRDMALTRFLLLCLDALSKGKTDSAVSYCTHVTDLDPKNATAYKLRGNAYLHSGRPQQAVDDFTRAIKFVPGDADSYRFRGNAYVVLKRDVLALADYDRAIILTPDNPINFQLRGYLYQIRSKFRLAIADFRPPSRCSRGWPRRGTRVVGPAAWPALSSRLRSQTATGPLPYSLRTPMPGTAVAWSSYGSASTGPRSRTTAKPSNATPDLRHRYSAAPSPNFGSTTGPLPGTSPPRRQSAPISRQNSWVMASSCGQTARREPRRC